jgi:hypothetical protein
MSEHVAAVHELFDQAEALGEGPAQLAMLEEAVRLADTHQDDELGYQARRKLIWPAYDIGRYDILMIHFSWCLGHADRHPQQHQRDMLWAYRWVVNGMPGFPEIARDQIENTMEDMARRYAEAGYSLRPVHILRRTTYKALGDRIKAGEADAQILTCPRDDMADDRNTERAFRISYLTYAKDYKQAVYLAEPFLQDMVDDRHFTAMVRSDVLQALARLGRVEEARVYQRQAYSYASQNPRFIGWITDQLEFLAMIGDFPHAIRMAEKHFPAALNHKSKSSHFYFFSAVILLLDRLLRNPSSERTSLLVAENLVPSANSVSWPLDELKARLELETQKLSALFDSRNGNRHYAEQLEEQTELHEIADRLQVRGTG